MAPVIFECQRRLTDVHPIICLTGQHREMLDQVVNYFGIKHDIALDLMTPNQILASVTAKAVEKLDEVYVSEKPDCIVAQGDTTTVMAAAMVSFYRHIPFFHVEAGLRTGDLQAPWPEEFNRRVVSLVAGHHFAPTPHAANALLKEGVPASIITVTGNTVIDALLFTIGRERLRRDYWANKYSFLEARPLVLITGHRRENIGEGLENICRAILILARDFCDHSFVYPVHPNPNVHAQVFRILDGQRNIHLVAPAAYPEFIWLLDRCTLVLTDSGGVQEEAPTLRKPVLVMREKTERPEGIEAGTARLVGTSTDLIVKEVRRLLTDSSAYKACQREINPYGDGRAAQRIVDRIVRYRYA